MQDTEDCKMMSNKESTDQTKIRNDSIRNSFIMGKKVSKFVCFLDQL